MKKSSNLTISLLASIILLFSAPFIAAAQKLPKVQLAGVRAPDGIKIDGKTTEWKDEFQAYNGNNRIYYTLSNDDNYLYLTVRTGDLYASEKFLFGINLAIGLPEGKGIKSKDKMVVTYPPIISVEENSAMRMMVTRVRRIEKDPKDSTKIKIDSLRALGNRSMEDAYTEIELSGIKQIQEPTISIYNTEGIKVAAKFNEQMLCVYELAIPLKYVQPFLNNAASFGYNIKMDGISRKVPGRFPPPVVQMEGVQPDYAYISYSTDFSGTYTIVKK